MPSPIEIAFCQHLTQTDSLRHIVEWDLPFDILPTESLRAIHEYAIGVWDLSGGQSAPSADVVREHFDNTLAEAEVPIELEAEHPVEATVNELRGMYIKRNWGSWMRDAATKMAPTTVLDAPEILGGEIDRLLSMHSRITRVSEQVDLSRGVLLQETEYERRVAMLAAGGIEGIIFGLPMIDTHTNGIKAGELGIFAGPPKTGKSWMLLHGCLAYWRLGGEPVLFTLENSVEMTLQRLAVLATGIDSRRYQRGEVTENELARLAEWRDEVLGRDNKFHVIQPERGKRTMEQMVRRGRSMGDAIYLDQLTFVEAGADSQRKPKWEQVGGVLHDAKALITSGERIPMLMAHQINREGQKAAEKAGRLEMYHMAESAEVERTADWAFGLWQSRALREGGRAWFQSLASRREDLIHWEIRWRPWLGLGNVQVRGPIVIED